MISWKKAMDSLRGHIPQLEEEDDLADLLFIAYCDLGISIRELSSFCQVSPSALRSKLLKLSICPKNRGGSRGMRTTFLREDLEEMSLKELCLKYKVSKTTASKARRKNKEN